ncbi:MAG TPA: glycosyltransferase family 4 protein [Gemmatimonadales bacterium]|nr:glycosyltransferase family 4 protein [Gemmatimonadales bacterium]
MTSPRRALRVTAVTASAQFGGTERVLLDFAARAFEHDLALRVLTPRDGPLIPVLNEIGVPAAVVPAPGALLRGSQQLGHLGSIPKALAGLPRWGRALAAHPYWRDADVLYTIAFKAHAAAALRRRHPVVWHLHEFPPATIGRLWKVAAQFVPDALIANSHATGRAWFSHVRPPVRQSAGPPALSAKRPGATSPLVVVPNGVDVDRFVPRQPTGWIHQALRIPREHRLIGMPAVLARWKGQLEAIEAFTAVARQFPGVHLVLVGGSIYDTVAESAFGSELDRRIAALTDARGQVHLLGFQAKVERVYPEFDLVIHYSLRPEAFGRVIVESLACGVPVIAAAEGGPVEILTGPPKSGRAGWLVPPRHPAALADTLRQALALPAAQLKDMGREGRQLVEDRYAARRFAREVAGVLRSAALGIPPSG